MDGITSMLHIEIREAHIISLLFSNPVRHVVNPTTNHEQAGASKCKGDGNGGDHIVTAFKVGVLGQVLEILLLLHKLLTWEKWCF